MKELLVALACIILMTGVQFTLLYSHILVNLIVGSTLGLGTLGLYSMYQSRLCRNKQKRWLLLVTGLFSLLIAYVTLEGLL